MSVKNILSALFFLMFLGSPTIKGAPADCLDCMVPNNLSATLQPDGTYLLSWSTVPDASKYNIEVEDEQNNPSTFQLETSSTTNTYSLSNLQSGVMYKFKVRTICNNDKSDWSDWHFFQAGSTNGGGGSGNSCSTPGNLSVMVLSDSTIQLKWDTVPGALSYTIDLEDEQNNPSNFHLETNTSGNIYLFTGFQANTLYKFKVKTICASGNSIYSSWQFFNSNGSSTGGNGNNNGNGSGNGTCQVPSGIAVQTLTSTSVTISWNTVSGAAGYEAEIEKDHKNGNQFSSQTLQTDQTSIQIDNLLPNTRYKVKVRTNCGTSHSNWSKKLRFKTPNQFNPEQSADRSSAEHQSSKLAIYPNPASELLNINLDSDQTGAVTISMLSLSGQRVYFQQIQIENGANTVAIPVNNFTPGMYIIQVAGADFNLTKKVIVQK